jgi:tetratricopeptide (TPR) repeat protein
MLELHTIDIENIDDKLMYILDKYSSKELTQQEIQNLYNRDKNVKYYLSLLDKFKQANSSNEDQFLNSIIDFMGTSLSNKSQDELHQILLIYLLTIASYIVDFFNTQNLKNKKKHIKTLKKLFIDATQNVLKTYEKKLLQTIEKINHNLDNSRSRTSDINKHKLNEALQLHQEEKFDEAALIYKSILNQESENFDALHLLGAICLKKEQWSEAIEYFDKAIKLAPDYAQAYSNKGIALTELNLLDEALQNYTLAITIKPDYANAHYSKANILRKLKRPKEALESYKKAIKLEPDNAEYFFKQGVVLDELKQFDAAIKSYKKAIKIGKNYPDAYYNIGNILEKREEFNEALLNYDKAIHLKPDYKNAYYNKGVILDKLERFEEALKNYDKAISIKEDWAEAYSAKAKILNKLNRLDEAIQNYNQAIEVDSNYVGAYINKAILLLLLGDFQKGFELYEWRFKDTDSEITKCEFSQPLWLGNESLQDKTILLHSEQGISDAIQFCRYAKEVSNLGAKVILQVHKSLIKLLHNLDGVDKVISEGNVEFDYRCPMLSLPHAMKTTIDTIPQTDAYIFSDKKIVSIWKERLGTKTKPRVGIVWSGNAKHKNDHNRSIALKDFIKYLPKDYEYISLQKEIIDSDKKTLKKNKHIKYFGDEIKDFSDTAALCELVDLVISVDTSVAHLSAAMGKETWILLPYIPDWRWLLDTKDSPWYNSVQLYRQNENRDWNSVLEKVASDLKKLF